MIQRTFEFVPKDGGAARTITATVDDPRPVDSNWGAVLRIEGFDEPYAETIIGADGFQAVLLAIGLVPAVMGTMSEGGALSFRGNTDFDCRRPELTMIELAFRTAEDPIVIQFETPQPPPEGDETWTILVRLNGRASKLRGMDPIHALEQGARFAAGYLHGREGLAPKVEPPFRLFSKRGKRSGRRKKDRK